MANLIKRAFGRFVNCVDRNTGRPYTDWRAEYYGCNGIIKLGESEHKHPGWRFVYFYPYVEGAKQPWFNTPTAEYQEDGNMITLTSQNSIWTFEFGEFDMTEDQKQEMALNMMSGVF